MQLSTLYAKQTDKKRFYTEGSTSGSYIDFDQSRRYIDMYTDKTDFDKSCVYTMCTNDNMNIITQFKSVNYNADIIKFDVEHVKYNNAVIFNSWNISENISDFVLTGSKEMTGWLTLLTNLNIQNFLLVPKIWVIDKTKDLTFVGSNYNCLSSNDIIEVTLQQLYENKDKYIVIDFNIKAYYITNNRYFLGLTTPYRVYFNNTDQVTGGTFSCSNGTGFINTKTASSTVTYGRRGTGASQTVWLKGYNYDDTTNNYIFTCLYPLDIENKKDDTYEIITETNGGWIVKHGSDSFACKNFWTSEYIITLLSSLGVYISWNNTIPSSTTSIPLASSTNTAIGEMDTNGFTTGKLITPDEKASSGSPNLEYGVFTDSIANPDKYKPIRPDEKTIDNTTFGNYECNSGGVRYYGMSSTQYFAFNLWINGDLESGYEPLKSVVYFAYQPFRSDTTFMPDQDGVKIGGKASVQMKPLNKSTSRHYLGSYNVSRIHNNFLDYNPYTDITVYIPLCGEIVLPVNIVMGNTIKTYLITDSQTGGSTGYVTAVVNGNEIIVGHRTGQFVQNMPLSSNEVGLRKQAETQSLMALGGSAVSTGLGIATGNPLAIIGGVGGLIASTVNGVLSSNTNRTQSTGALSDVINFNMPLQCYIRITSPYVDINDNYGHNTGYMCNKVKQIADCNGYTVCSNIDTSGLSCTETEKEMIKNALENGCYL